MFNLKKKTTMTKEQLFKKYNIKSNNCKDWEDIDSWIGVDLYALMHNNTLPNNEDKSLLYVLKFLDKPEPYMSNPKFGSLYMTAKRSVFRFADQILDEINKVK